MRKHLLWVALAVACVTTGCGRREKTTAPSLAASASASVPLPPPSASTAPSLPSASAGDVDGARQEREGRITLRLKDGGSVTLEHSPGKTRIDLHRLPRGAEQELGAIVRWPEKEAVLLLHSQKSYAEMSLDDTAMSKAALAQWRLTTEGKTETVAGTKCELWELTDGTYRVSACLGRGPIHFETHAIEQALGIDLPEWGKRLLAGGYLPLRVSVQSASGQKLVTEEVVEWKEEPVKAADFERPKDYRRVSWQKPRPTRGKGRK